MVLVPADSKPVVGKCSVSLARDYLHRREAGRDDRHSPGGSFSVLRKVRLRGHARTEKQSRPLQPRERNLVSASVFAISG